MTFGEQIKQAREQKNISQEDLADRLGVSRQAVSKWENDLALPHGVNKEMLGDVLELELTNSNKTTGRNKVFLLSGWIAAAVLLVAMLMLFAGFQRTHVNGPEAPGTGKEPAFQHVRFYDSEMNEVLSEALWYDAAKIECILIQWSGGSAENVKMFSTPAGTQTVEETQLLLTKGILDGESVALLSARTLKDQFQSHIFFALDFGGSTITSEIYNIFDHSSPEETA